MLKEGQGGTVNPQHFQTMPNSYSAALFYVASIAPPVLAGYRSDFPTPGTLETVALAVGGIH